MTDNTTTMAQKATTTGQIFNGLMKKTQVFRTKLRTELGDKILEFAPSEQDIIFYCDEWLAMVVEERQLGTGWREIYVDDDDEKKATEEEIIEKMIEFLGEEDCEKEIYEQIHRKQQPTMVSSQGSHYFEQEYGSDLPIYLNEIFVRSGGDRYFGKEGEFLLFFLKEEVEGIINKTMREHLKGKLTKKD